MGRTNDRDNQLSKLSALIDLLRSKNVLKFNGLIPDVDMVEPIEILMGPPPSPKTKEADKDPLAARRAFYQNQLGREHITNAELELLP